MSQSRNLICGGLSLVLVSCAGCAGNGLRNMFSRNETRGYSPLEELEAAQNRSAAADSAVTTVDENESRGPRFASWIPFAGTPAEDSDNVAKNQDDSDIGDADSAPRWWGNPFHRRDEAETDPFLTADAESATEITGTDEQAGRFESDPADRTQVRAVGGTQALDENATGDNLLIGKFEQHFKQNTAETAAADEHAEPLIIAGVKSPNPDSLRTPSGPESAAASKLTELEKLLADKQTTANRRKQRVSELAQHGAAELTTASQGFEPDGESAEKVAKKTPRPAPNTTRDTNSRPLNSFDDLLGTSGEALAAATDRGLKVPVHMSRQKASVSVADAESLFGKSVRGVISSAASAPGERPDDRSGNDATATMGHGFQWAQTQLTPLELQHTDKARKAIESTADQFASVFQASRHTDSVPAAVLNDPPESAIQMSAGIEAGSQSPRSTIETDRHVLTVSTSRESSGVNSRAGLADDAFFSAGQTAAQTSRTTATSVSSTKESAPRGSRVPLTRRNWLLLLGGIIVVALLFAPGRRKSVTENQAPVQG